MEPTEYEEQSKLVASLLVYAFKKMEKTDTLPGYVKPASTALYGDEYHLNEMVVLLCSEIRSMDKQTLENVVYDGHSKQSRKLADWWDRHSVADKKRKN